MADFTKARAHLIQAYIALQGASPEEQRLQRAVSLLVDAAVRTQRELSAEDNVVEFRRNRWRGRAI